MSLLTRTATIQVRVVPLVKQASEEVLWRIGLNMSEAVELFLRQVIAEERIPFDVTAVTIDKIGVGASEGRGGGQEIGLGGSPGAAKKEFKKISGGPTPTQIRARKALKRTRN